MGNEQTKNEVATGVGIQSMDQQLQRKFSKGIQFNMKIVVKGDRNSGKTCLFHRLQGKPFLESYIPTEEIQVTSILWSYKDTLDTVKVEVWDVVDKGKIQKKKKKGNLKLFNDPDVQTPADQPLDAQFLDVYKGTHGVIFMFDMTKQWTYQYVTRELPLVPYHIPIVVMGNFRDMGEHRVVTTLEVMNFVEFLERPEGSADVKYAECSMKDGFGLKYLHRFFSIPFLHLQQESLLRQLQVNRELLVSTMEELAVDENSEDQNYQLFKDAIDLKQHQREKRLAEEKAAAEAASSSENADTTTNNMEEESTDSKTLVGKANSGRNMETVVSQESPATRKSSFKEKLSQKFSSKKTSPIMAKKEQKPVTVAKATTKSSKAAVTDIDNFVPDEEMDNNFLAEDGNEEHNKLYEKETDSDDSEDNPLVAADEDIDSSDEEQQQQPKQQIKTVEPVQSSGDSDAEEKQETIETKPKQEQKTPPTPVKPASTRPTLLSAKSVELTESSSEEDDEAERLVQKKPATKPAKTSAPPTQKSSGLMLQHSIPTTSKPEVKKTTEDTTATEVKEEKKKKKSSQKKKKQKEEKDDTTILPAVATTTTTSDPFSSSLLDAWLDSPSGDSLTPVLKPTTAAESSKKKVTVDDDDEPGDATEEKKKHRHKRHKHKHKHSEGSSGEKKKHRHKAPSTESSEPHGNDYVALL